MLGSCVRLGLTLVLLMGIGLASALSSLASRFSSGIPSPLTLETTLAPAAGAPLEAMAVELTSRDAGARTGVGGWPTSPRSQNHAAMLQWIDESRIQLLGSGVSAQDHVIEPVRPYRTFLRGLFQGSEDQWSTRARWNLRVREDAYPGLTRLVFNSVAATVTPEASFEREPHAWREQEFRIPSSAEVTIAIEVTP